MHRFRLRPKRRRARRQRDPAAGRRLCRSRRQPRSVPAHRGALAGQNPSVLVSATHAGDPSSSFSLSSTVGQLLNRPAASRSTPPPGPKDSLRRDRSVTDKTGRSAFGAQWVPRRSEHASPACYAVAPRARPAPSPARSSHKIASTSHAAARVEPRSTELSFNPHRGPWELSRNLSRASSPKLTSRAPPSAIATRKITSSRWP